ncbi:hypothetical protein [Spiroplasma endosymbiont of Amphibalanus improvisus]|uniref:hypothetical protein n=1 Tax=Spiroplasma endosymbiont of Amphibalanus improvisus TaxID=3066327 RepID=UPI00313F050A
MDSLKNNEVIKIKVQESEIENFKNKYQLFDNLNNNEDKKSQILLSATIARELLVQYFNDENHSVKTLIEYLEEYRHYLTCEQSFKNLNWKIFNSENKINLALSKFIKSLAFISENEKKTDESISEFVLSYDIEKFESFNKTFQYILHKYMVALKIRFLIEKKYGRDRNKYQKLILNIYEFSEMILHLNNLRWDAIFETPLYKLKKYYDLI